MFFVLNCKGWHYLVLVSVGIGVCSSQAPALSHRCDIRVSRCSCCCHPSLFGALFLSPFAAKTPDWRADSGGVVRRRIEGLWALILLRIVNGLCALRCRRPVPFFPPCFVASQKPGHYGCNLGGLRAAESVSLLAFSAKNRDCGGVVNAASLRVLRASRESSRRVGLLVTVIH